MFSQGGTPVQVAIELNLREKDVSELYREYWTLNGIYELNQIYNEVKNDIWTIIELHRRLKEEKLDRDQVCKILKTTETLEHNNRILEDEQYRLTQSNKHAAELFQHFTNLISIGPSMWISSYNS